MLSACPPSSSNLRYICIQHDFCRGGDNFPARQWTRGDRGEFFGDLCCICELLPSHKSKSLMRSCRVQVFILVHRVYKHRVVVSDNAQRGFVNPPMVRDHEEPFAMKGTESNRKRDWGHWEIAREEERGRKSLDGSIAQMLLPRSWQRATLDSLTIKWRACHRFLSSLPFNDMKLWCRDHGAEKSHQEFRTILRTTRI